jgi:hypothetical protein
VKGRFITMAEYFGFDDTTIDVHFIEGARALDAASSRFRRSDIPSV